MKRAIGSAGLALVALLTASGAVAAGTRTAVTMDVPTTFDEVADHFTATGLAGCATGVVEDGGAKVVFAPPHGVFAGDKVFLCDGSDSGMVVRLNARFGNPGSVGTWAIIDSWGVLAGLQGQGSLTGDPIPNGILDHYTGSIVR
jgi:hypothetical protein